MSRRRVSGWMFLLVPAHPGSPGQRAVKWLCVCEVALNLCITSVVLLMLLLLLLLLVCCLGDNSGKDAVTALLIITSFHLLCGMQIIVESLKITVTFVMQVKGQLE